jgi:preprotein translocase subunit SecE
MIFNKLINFLKEAKEELSKVSWSTRSELIGASGVVIAVTAILTAFIGVVDFMLTRFLAVVMK